MQRLEVSGAVRPVYGSLGVKRLRDSSRETLVVRRNRTSCTKKCVRVLQLGGVTIKCRLNAAVTVTNMEVHIEFCSNQELHIEFCSNEE